MKKPLQNSLSCHSEGEVTSVATDVTKPEESREILRFAQDDKSEILRMTPVKGFSLIELLLAVSIVGILAVTAVPVFRGLLSENDLAIGKMMLSQAARRAEANARAIIDDSDWGMYAASGRAVVFKGNNFSSRDETQDATFALPSSIKFSETTVIFSRFTALPSQSVSLSLKAVNGNTVIWALDTQGIIN